jgi:hypothetical protein
MQDNTSSSLSFGKTLKVLLVAVSMLGGVFAALYALGKWWSWIENAPEREERAARAIEQKRAWSTGSFPACADQIRRYYETKDGNQYVWEIKGNPSSMTKNDDIVTGDIGFSYSYRRTADASPEQAAQAYAAGAAIGLDKDELAEAAARAMSSDSSDYTRKVKYIYNASKDSCELNKYVIDTETGQSKPLSN